MSRYLDVVAGDTTVLAGAVARDPGATVACYDGWDLADLGRHVGQIHRWVTGAVEARAQERPASAAAPDVPAEDLPDWLVAGAERLVEVLAAAGPDEPVWTISRTERTVVFWRRRMALETVLHRWDAEDALGLEPVVPAPLALEGLEETLDVYLEQRLDGRDVGGRGQRVAFVPAGTDGWTMTLHPEGVEVAAGHDRADATVAGDALDLWLLLSCRRGLDAIPVTGDRDAAELAARAATLSPGPAG